MSALDEVLGHSAPIAAVREQAARLLRPAARFQRTEPPAPPQGVALTHPYRIEPFLFMLAENATEDARNGGHL